MPHTTERGANNEARERADRTLQASIVTGLQTILEGDEQLLAFGRGHISGGWRGKLAVGPEAFFAPDVNVGLTERRFVMQHIHATTGKPSEILPHFFPLSEIAAITFSDIETFGGEPSGRLVLRLQDDQHFRIRVTGQGVCNDAQALVEVFRSMTTARSKSPVSPTQSLCPTCKSILDKPYRFCPYCGSALTNAAPPVAEREPSVATEETNRVVTPEPPVPPTPPAPPEAPIPPPPMAATESVLEEVVSLPVVDTTFVPEPTTEAIAEPVAEVSAGDAIVAERSAPENAIAVETAPAYAPEPSASFSYTEEGMPIATGDAGTVALGEDTGDIETPTVISSAEAPAPSTTTQADTWEAYARGVEGAPAPIAEETPEPPVEAAGMTWEQYARQSGEETSTTVSSETEGSAPVAEPTADVDTIPLAEEDAASGHPENAGSEESLPSDSTQGEH